MHAFTLNTPLQNIFDKKAETKLTKGLLLLFGVFLLAFSGQLSIPLQPVPLTFQSTAVVFVGMIFGARNALYCVSLYLLAGFAGLPILADFSGGPVYFTGPTAGYLMGFVPAAWLGGFLAQKGMTQHWLTSLVAAYLSVSVIFICGVTWLSTFVGWQTAIKLGLMPFMLTEFMKLCAVAVCAPKCWKKK